MDKKIFMAGLMLPSSIGLAATIASNDADFTTKAVGADVMSGLLAPQKSRVAVAPLQSGTDGMLLA